MSKLAIIGASHFQNPLILKAKEMGIETHVFAWETGDVGESTADVFHPISIMDKELILEECQRIGVDGIVSIGTDLGNVTVAYVADAMGLTCNSVDCVAKSTNKELMRNAFDDNGDPSPKSMRVDSETACNAAELSFPVIVKPADRSGSRGVTKVTYHAMLKQAIRDALDVSFVKVALVEEFVEGQEYSVEYLSWRGNHQFLAITEKFTTGAPRFIETGHLEPARITADVLDRVKTVIEHALDSLGVEYGASHSEVKIADDGTIKIIEIGSRMGGDCIGSDLVELSTGYDFVRAVIDVSMGRQPQPLGTPEEKCAAVRFVLSEADLHALERVKEFAPKALVYESEMGNFEHEVTDSSTRFGYFIVQGSELSDLLPFLPEDMIDDH